MSHFLFIVGELSGPLVDNRITTGQLINYAVETVGIIIMVAMRYAKFERHGEQLKEHNTMLKALTDTQGKQQNLQEQQQMIIADMKMRVDRMENKVFFT